MASRVTGSAAAWLNRIELGFDPRTGDRYRLTFQGPKAAILAVHGGYRLSGLRTTATNRGPLWECTVDIGVDTTTGLGETPVDNYNIDMEPVQVSIWSHPAVMAAATSYGNRASFKKIIEDAVKAGVSLSTTPLSGNAAADDVWILLSRGTEAYEVKRCVLSRVRTFSISYAARYVISAPEKIYTRAALIRDFAIPPIVAGQLPTDVGLTTLTGAAWSWKVRTDRSEYIPALSRIQETKDWVFAAWSTALYGTAVT